jgi:hypothetical protein
MAIQELATSFVEEGNRISTQAYEYVEVNVAATAATIATVAPANGKLKRGVLTAGADALDATDNYITILLVNKSNSDAAMFGSNDTGDGTDTAAFATRVMVLGATADLVVSEGDYLELVTTVQGTITAATKMTLVYEID